LHDGGKIELYTASLFDIASHLVLAVDQKVDEENSIPESMPVYPEVKCMIFQYPLNLGGPELRPKRKRMARVKASFGKAGTIIKAPFKMLGRIAMRVLRCG